MHAWEAIQKTLEYIECHLGDEIKTDDLAAAAALSPFYYQRLFTRLVKRPVGEYIKLRRLAGASQALKTKNDRILDIAVEFGFNGHETFTRAFKEAYGLTPVQYRENPDCLNHFDKPDLLLNYVMIDEGVPLISDGMVLEINRKSIGKPLNFIGVTGNIPIDGQMPLGEQTGVDMPGRVWEHFHKVKHGIPKKPGGCELGAAYMGNAPEGCFTYFAGVETEEKSMAGMESWTLPAREYAVCGFEAQSKEELVTTALNKAVKYFCSWLEKHGLAMDEYSPEVYPGPDTDKITYMELWAPCKPKK